MMITVNIPSPLRSYTANKSSVQAEGKSVHMVLRNLDAKHAGILFRILDEQDRIREHIQFYVNKDQAHDLNIPLRDGDTLHIICALSGG